MAEEEKRIATDRAVLDQQKEFIRKEQDRLNELAKKIQTEMEAIETFSKVNKLPQEQTHKSHIVSMCELVVRVQTTTSL